MPRITKITNQGIDTGKYGKSLKESRERGFTNVTKTPKITIIARITKIMKIHYQGYTVRK